MVHIVKQLCRRALRRASYQIVLGRLIEPGQPERGRFLRGDIDDVLARTWRHLDRLLPEAELDRLPTRGSRHNVFLAMLTVAGYHAYLDAGIAPAHAMDLMADVGWKLYVRWVRLPRLIARMATRDPQRRLALMLRLALHFPFSAPGRPAYEVTAWAEADHFSTFWTHCPPYAFVKRYVDAHGDRGELEAFRRSWCSYDWAITHAMVGGDRRAGHYERPHTLSAGDPVCDMRWYAQRPADRPLTRP